MAPALCWELWSVPITPLVRAPCCWLRRQVPPHGCIQRARDRQEQLEESQLRGPHHRGQVPHAHQPQCADLRQQVWTSHPVVPALNRVSTSARPSCIIKASSLSWCAFPRPQYQLLVMSCGTWTASCKHPASRVIRGAYGVVPCPCPVVGSLSTTLRASPRQEWGSGWALRLTGGTRPPVFRYCANANCGGGARPSLAPFRLVVGRQYGS